MLIHEVEEFLARCGAADQLADGAQAIRAVTASGFTRALDQLVGMLFGQAEQTVQNTNAFNAPRGEDALSPAARMRSDAVYPAHNPLGAALDAADLLGRDVLALGAEAAGLMLDVQGDLLPTLV